MRTLRKNWGKAAAIAGAGLMLLTLFTARLLWGQAAPALSIALNPTNTVSLTVTNGTNNGIYSIYWTELLAGNLSISNGTWAFITSGTTGQTNFLIDYGEFVSGFFRAVNGNDWDGDGILNSQDARPFDPGIGILTVTIESPTNNSTVQ